MSNVFSIFFVRLSHALIWLRRPQGRIPLLLAAVLLLAVESRLAISITTTGILEKQPSSGIYEKFVHFNLNTESVVSLNPTLGCKEGDTRMRLYSEHDESHIGETYVPGVSPEPWTSLPLAAGNWRVKLYCDYGYYEEPPTYSLTYSYTQFSSVYAKDSETQPVSNPNAPISLTKGRAFSGWMGFLGYESVAPDPYYSYRYGEDGSDCYYFDLKAGTTIQVRLEYDNGFINSMSPYPYPNNADIQLYVLPTDRSYPYTLYKNWQKSGDLSEAIPLSQDGTYRFCAKGMPSTDSIHQFKQFPKTNYGGYRMSVIVNGDDPLYEPIKLGFTDIVTEYVQNRGEKPVTVNQFVPGETSKLIIPVSSDKNRQILLVAGLSVKNEPFKPIGVKTCSVSKGTQYCIMHTDRIDKSIKSLLGKLTIIAYIDNKNVADSKRSVRFYLEGFFYQMGMYMLLFDQKPY